MYKLFKNNDGDITGAFKNNTFIPLDPANTDYQVYLEWLAEGNTPEPADE